MRNIEIKYLNTKLCLGGRNEIIIRLRITVTMVIILMIKPEQRLNKMKYLNNKVCLRGRTT